MPCAGPGGTQTQLLSQHGSQVWSSREPGEERERIVSLSQFARLLSYSWHVPHMANGPQGPSGRGTLATVGPDGQQRALPSLALRIGNSRRIRRFLCKDGRSP